MPLYEVMFIVQPDIEGDALENSINKVKEVMEKDGGQVLSIKKMGKKKLAYEINDFKEGFYVLVNLNAGKEVVPALDHFFKVNEGYLRYIVIRLEEEKEIQAPEKENIEEVKKEDSKEQEAL